jgi:glycosyltransferase involved in cell wall biosynthesis
MEGIEVIRPRYWWPEQWEFLRKAGPAGLPVAWQKYPLARIQVLPFLLVHTLTAARHARSCDLIHAQWTLSAAAAYLGKWLHSRPIIVTVQGSDIFQVPTHPIGAWLTTRILRRCDRITALSQALKDATASLGIHTEKIRVVPNGVDTTRFTPPVNSSRDDVILYVGTLIERKGLEYLLSAMSAVFESFSSYRLALVGEGPQESKLKQLAEDLGVAKRVSFLGFQPPERVRMWMQRAKVLVLPSLEEGMGVVLLEALACGTPVVGSQVDGIQEVITPDVGLLVPPADSAALSKAIQSILSNTQRWTDMSQHARERAVTHYDWDYVADQFITLYQSMV